MPEPGLNPRAELKEFLGSLIFVLEGGQDARPPLSNDSLEAVLASLDDRILADLLSYFQRCSGQGALLSADHPLEHCSPDADVRLTWPYQGQYCIPVDSEYRFVHPDPAGVLNRALDRFLGERLLSIVNLHLDAEATRQELTRIHQLRYAAGRLIELIAEAQAALLQQWLQKRPVREAHYCITLDRVPRELYPEIAANAAQWAEWARLYPIEGIEPEGPGIAPPQSPGDERPVDTRAFSAEWPARKLAATEERPAATAERQATTEGRSVVTEETPATEGKLSARIAFLEAHPHLMLDTRFFDQGFTDRLLESFDDLDGQLDGLLIHADNFHALNLLDDDYRGRIDCIYTDPPYNTGGADLPYPDRFDGATWLTLMENRFRLAHRLLKPGGACFVSIDEHEGARLELLLSGIFRPEDFVATFVWEAGRKNDSRLVSVSHEYMLCFVKDFADAAGKGLTWRMRKEGIDEIYRKARALVRKCKGDHRRASLLLRQWLNGLPDNHPARRHKHYNRIDERGVYHAGNISWPGGGGPRYEVLHPVTGRPCKVPSRGWMYPTPERMADAIREGLVHFGPDETRVPCAKVYLHTNEHQAPGSVFYRDGRAAMKRLRHVLGGDCFCNPKDELVIAERIGFACGADATVLDFFAGSGSAAHAVIHLNRTDGGRRRYILVESGNVFDTVLRTRIQRIVFASRWKHGRPASRDGISHLFKYLRLEP